MTDHTNTRPLTDEEIALLPRDEQGNPIFPTEVEITQDACDVQ